MTADNQIENPSQEFPQSQPQRAVDPRLVLTVNEVIKLSGLSRTSVNQLIGDGTLNSVKVLKRRLILKDSFYKLLGMGGEHDRA